MSIDFSALQNALIAIQSGVQSFFNNIWSSVGQIVNTGQGLYAGLVHFGSALWDSIIKFGQSIENGLVNAFTAIGEHLRASFDTLGSWISQATKWVGDGLTWIGTKISEIGKWIWDGLNYVYNQLVGLITYAWNALVNTAEFYSRAIQNWWGSVTTGINAWWTNTIVGVRGKIRESIMASITISTTWKAAEGLLDPEKFNFFEEGGFKGMLSGLGKIIAAPILGMLVGSIIDAMIPSPHTNIFPLLPNMPTLPQTTPPQLTVGKLGVTKPIIETISENVVVQINPVVG